MPVVQEKLSLARLFDREEAANKELIAKMEEEEEGRLIFTNFLNPGYKGYRPDFTEIITANDFGILLQKVVTDQLQMPVEPEYLGINLFSTTINVDVNTVFQYPIMGAIWASDVARNMPIPRTDPTFTQEIIATSNKRSAIAFDVEPYVLKNSMYNLIPLLTEAGRRGLNRWKERKVWNTTMQRAHIMFDNSNATNTYWTGGRASDGVTPNGSITFNNFIDMMGGLATQGHVATDCATHPLGWAMLHKDPLLRAQFFTMGQIGKGIYTKIPGITDADQQALFPWGVAFHATRFMNYTLNGTFSGGLPAGTGAATLIDILMLDRNRPVLIVQTTPIQMEQWQQSPEIKVITIGMEEEYEVHGIEQGKSAVLAKNVRLVENHEPIFNVGMVTL